MIDKRAQYRVDLPPGYVLAVVSADTRSSFRADVFDMSFGGARVLVRGLEAKALAVGATLAIELSGPPLLGGGIRLWATVRHLAPAENSDGAYAGVQFGDPSRVHKLIPAELHLLFNRRRALRVEPGPGAGIDVEVRPFPSPPTVSATKAILRDISGTGIALSVDDETARLYPQAPTLDLTFKLPTSTETLVVAATLRNRIPLDRGERWGLFFEGHGSRDWGAYERTIAQYVARRQLDVRRV